MASDEKQSFFDTAEYDEIKNLLGDEPAEKKAPGQAAPAAEEPAAAAPEKPARKRGEKAPQQKESSGYEAYTMLHDLVTILAVVTVLFVFFFRLVGVDGSSMYPTFVNHDYLILESNFLYHTVDRGDIVVLSVDAFADQGPIVKRVIATGGQTVNIDFDTGTVYVDGKALSEDYTFEPTYESYEEYGLSLDYPVTVPEGSVFVMGDNRNHSADSRYSPVGCVEESRILGKAIFILFPGQQTDELQQVTGGRNFGRIGVIS